MKQSLIHYSLISRMATADRVYDYHNNDIRNVIILTPSVKQRITVLERCTSLNDLKTNSCHSQLTTSPSYDFQNTFRRPGSELFQELPFIYFFRFHARIEL